MRAPDDFPTLAVPKTATDWDSPIEALAESYIAVRRESERACEVLAVEDYGLQAAAFASPPKWHLAHTTWFFETFLLKPFLPDYRDFHVDYGVLFNSYYNGIGPQFPRPQRGLLSRPTVAEVYEYRQRVDEEIVALLDNLPQQHAADIRRRVLLGIHHEQQHQELFYTDLKYSFSVNPLHPAYAAAPDLPASEQTEQCWIPFDAGLRTMGHDPAAGFAFDNEGPQHRVHLEAFALSRNLVSNADYQAFVDDGGYRRAELWLADGWTHVQDHGWAAPLYWQERDGEALEFTLYGLRRRHGPAPVAHLSAYEADAYARWAGARLPTEFEWEAAAQDLAAPAIQTPQHLHPTAATDSFDLGAAFDQVWQWTSSAYSPYPGFRASADAIGEYNGKFMCNQLVLRGSSCVTSAGHARSSYRNFFYPADRWQFSGLRLARSL